MTCRFTTLHTRAPRAAISPHPHLRSVLTHRYTGFDEDSMAHSAFVVPAGVETPLVVDVRPSMDCPPALVYGPRGSHTVVESDCPPAAIETCLAPLSAYTVFGPAVADAGESIIGLEELIGDDARLLGERIQAAPRWVDRVRLLDEFLLDRWARGPQPAPEVCEAWELLVRSGGTRAIGEIARVVGWSHKHLIVRFKQQVGVPPRLAARLLRLSRVWRRIGNGQSWARIAAESGYADQSHLVREFRKFTGTTPGVLAA